MSNSEMQIVDLAPTQKPAGNAITLASPGQLAQLAIERGDLDLDRLERLMVMQEKWEANEARKAYHAAFAAFKAEAVRIVKNRSVTDGPLKGKSYAELHSVVDAVTPALSRHGLSASWKLTKDDRDWLEVTCTLTHVNGHSESVSMGGPPDSGGAKNAIQMRASTKSYLERYTLKAITGLAEGGDDDDGGHGYGQTSSSEEHPNLQAGRDAAMQGMQSLTAWWGALNSKQRSALQGEFNNLRRAAQQADSEVGNG